MSYTVRNLTSRLLCLHGSSGASYYIHAKKTLEIDDVEIRNNATVDKLIKRNIVRLEHQAAKTAKPRSKADSVAKSKAKQTTTRRNIKAKK